MRIDAAEEAEKYKTQFKVTNALYESNQNAYFTLINNLRDNEENKANFIFYHFEKFIQMLTDISESLNEVIKSLKNSVLEVNIKKDMQMYNDKFNFVPNKDNNRLIKEEYFTYDVYRRNIEALINSTNINNNLTITERHSISST